MEVQVVSLNSLLKSDSIVTAHYNKYLLKNLGGRRDCRRGDRYVCYLDCGNGKGICVCQNPSNCMSICSLLDINYISI